MMKLLSAFLSMMAITLGSGSAAADAVPPDVMVRNTANEVLDIVRKDKDIQAGNMDKINQLTESKILPHFDFDRMSRAVIGKNWRLATPEQQAKFTAEFRNFLVRLYSSSLSKYRNQTIEYLPFRMQPGDTTVTVKTQIVQQGGPAIPLDYKLEKIGDEWKVTDFAVEGLRIVKTYQDQFDPIYRNSGMDGVIQTLVDKNNQAASGKKSS